MRSAELIRRVDHDLAGERPRLPARLGGWQDQIEKAQRALDANKARLDSAHSTGLASDMTLGRRGYDADPKGGG